MFILCAGNSSSARNCGKSPVNSIIKAHIRYFHRQRNSDLISTETILFPGHPTGNLSFTQYINNRYWGD